MMANLPNIPRHYYSLDEYFALEKASNARFEYWDGNIICKSGGTVNKYNLSSNILGALFSNLKGNDNKVYSGCVPIYTPKLSPYRYVDVTVICGEEQYQIFNGIHALNPPRCCLRLNRIRLHTLIKIKNESPIKPSNLCRNIF
jgi:Uma2 family endonuclease